MIGLKQDRLQVLKMIEEGKISAAEGLRLLDAFEARREGEPSRGQWLRIKVTHLSTGRSKATINVPLSLVETGLRFVPGGKVSFGPGGRVDVQELLEMIRSGQAGKLIEVMAEEEDARVEIFVD
jgi:hypothetical protein